MANLEAAGKYGKAAPEKLGLWAALKMRIAQAENVPAALLLVSRGETPAGILDRSVAPADARVAVLATFLEDTLIPRSLSRGADDCRQLPGRGGVLGQSEVAAGKEPLFEARGLSVVPQERS
jgi:molybdate transport system substrate-binding protein